MPFSVCPTCGMWDAARPVAPLEPGWAEAGCTVCGTNQRFRHLPLHLITGPSGAGKSTTIAHLLQGEYPFVPMDSDVLWGAIPVEDEAEKDAYIAAWLRVILNIHQAGKPVLLVGTLMPAAIEACAQRPYFSNVRYMALVSEDEEELRRRLAARPAWRGCDDVAFQDAHVAFNRWFLDHAGRQEPPVALLNTAHQSPADTVRSVLEWIEV